MSENNILRRLHTVTGQVQGVGFRPFVYKTALKYNLSGTVLNSPEGVLIEVQGTLQNLNKFDQTFIDELPRLARIISHKKKDLIPVQGEEQFCILASTAGEGHCVLISPDVATCPDCFADMNDPQNRRYEYPFTNCTNCGPRYTITRSIPYDRPVTSMACFPLCMDCKEEYENPLDRRFHAQPNACSECGPEVWLTDNDGNKLADSLTALSKLAKLLSGGRIAAIKGLGGFHLVCDASNPQAVQTLRERKNRPDKPLAVMLKDVTEAEKLADLTENDIELLEGLQRPIVLAPKNKNYSLAPEIAPDTDFIGLMVPYTPLHQVLLKYFSALNENSSPSALVMTSGNMSCAPICIGNREALKRLPHIADVFLFHNRDILIRVDDSVTRSVPEFNGEEKNRTIFMRRARGFTPSPVFLAQEGPCVLGTGPELKNTLCFTKGDQGFSSQHIGDMQNLETTNFWKEIRLHLQSILKIKPRLIVHDLHPDYLTTLLAEEIAQNESIETTALQHHYAHIYSVLAENKHTGPALGLALDGTGLGDDRTIWGGECLYIDNEKLEHRRIAHFTYLRLPGGEAAVREPWRIARAAATDLGLDSRQISVPAEFQAGLKMFDQILEKNINCPATSSCGRLFDAISAMLGLCSKISYEGQAAIILEKNQDHTEKNTYDCPVDQATTPFTINTGELFKQAYRDKMNGVPPATISRRFHKGLISGLADCAELAAAKTGVKTIGLSGGVMQNLTIAVELPEELKSRGLNPLVHRYLPPNDGCISLGQAVYGQILLNRRN
ncbi:carbamoyltransferase HypF [Maridesulfovibrio hydrothermalis]|uniref:Carbamoyltransferase n=1 Tax=Maridesulfovibrio hydrothermalis AM13 = DSM 14728 TaxID=1121451 RepID=L0RGG8_9BACT|nr:carbamoyltransferase HypF [Maridesulfovibrio hydrothermalis]CCO25310.1 Carbamoyltransferase hypF2 [Maridesulfovibrio hydrothermalis AM13 = DSM 14728]